MATGPTMVETDGPHEPGDPGAPSVDHARSSDPDVLVICRANVARSPLLRVRLEFEAARRVGAGTVNIASAGMSARFGDPAAEGSKRVAAGWGLSLEDHASLPIMYAPFATAPVNLVMSRDHLRALLARNPEVAPRTFTVPEFVGCIRRLETEGRLPRFDPRALVDETASGATGGDHRSAEALRQALRWHLSKVVALADARRPSGLRRRRHLDVPDPLREGPGQFEALGERFEADAVSIADALFGPLPD